MTNTPKPNPIPKVIALIVVSLCVAGLMVRFDASSLAKLDSMSPADVVQHQRELHHHSFLYHFVIIVVFGGFFIGIIEFITYLISLFIRRPAA